MTTYMCVRVADLATPSSPRTTHIRECATCGERVWSESSSRKLARQIGGSVEHECSVCTNARLKRLLPPS